MIYLITGGQRSGKSNYGQQLALSLSSNPVYLATSRIWDDDHKIRIECHKKEREACWENIEEEKSISKWLLPGRTVLLDCLTLWLTNFFVDTVYDVEKALQEAKEEFDSFVCQNMDLILITNEIGMGVHASTEGGRKFADLQGWMNQYVAEKSDHVVLMVSGIPVKIK